MADEILLTRFSLRRKSAVDLDLESPMAAEPALEIDTGNVRLSNQDGSSWTYYLLAVPRSGLNEGDTFQWRGGTLVRIPRQPSLANAAAATASSPTLGAIAMPAASPTDAAALRDDLVANALPNLESRTDELKDQLDALIADNTSLRSTINSLLARLRVSGGNGCIAD